MSYEPNETWKTGDEWRDLFNKVYPSLIDPELSQWIRLTQAFNMRVRRYKHDLELDAFAVIGWEHEDPSDESVAVIFSHRHESLAAKISGPEFLRVLVDFISMYNWRLQHYAAKSPLPLRRTKTEIALRWFL